ncbi:hypothetical protein Ahy_B07g087386 isoform A [Arachis hypogaea]|uniref:Uncharacterized protein n=1 Tax=Arachis hypogaea TaxID=3818 RepID=A0A444YBZ7_ARAHY|nr:hypothetical protein Ahy_B07g087386 isoform A [Arachis hypogaea]
MTNIIKRMYDHPWPSYKKIFSETRERWFQKWAVNFIWDKEHDALIGKIYDHQMGRQLQQMLEDVRERHDYLTSWLHLEIKKALYVHWETDEGFRHRRLTNRANRVLARSSKYTGGSEIFMKTKARLSKSLDCDAILAETFNYTHTLKENKERFADQRSADHYQNRKDASGSAVSVVDLEIASESYKNHVYGLESFFASSLRTSTLRPSSASATNRAINPEEGIDLRLQVQELIGLSNGLFRPI